MAVDLTAEQLRSALRLGDSATETAEAERLLTYAKAVIPARAPGASTVVHTEAAIRLCAYLYDKPFASRGTSYANALRNSGAGDILLPWYEPKVSK